MDLTGKVVAVGEDGVFTVDEQGGPPRFLTNGVFLNALSAVAWGSHGEIYVADKGSAGGGAGPNPGQGPTIVEVDPVTGDQTVIASDGFLQAPSAIVVVASSGSDLPAIPTTTGRYTTTPPSSTKTPSTSLSSSSATSSSRSLWRRKKVKSLRRGSIQANSG